MRRRGPSSGDGRGVEGQLQCCPADRQWRGGGSAAVAVLLLRPDYSGSVGGWGPRWAAGGVAAGRQEEAPGCRRRQGRPLVVFWRGRIRRSYGGGVVVQGAGGGGGCTGGRVVARDSRRPSRAVTAGSAGGGEGGAARWDARQWRRGGGRRDYRTLGAAATGARVRMETTAGGNLRGGLLRPCSRSGDEGKGDWEEGVAPAWDVGDDRLAMKRSRRGRSQTTRRGRRKGEGPLVVPPLT